MCCLIERMKQKLEKIRVLCVIVIIIEGGDTVNWSLILNVNTRKSLIMKVLRRRLFGEV